MPNCQGQLPLRDQQAYNFKYCEILSKLCVLQAISLLLVKKTYNFLVEEIVYGVVGRAEQSKAS